MTIIRQIWEYYNSEMHAAGGSLHIVLDDGNLENSDVKYCIDWAQRHKDRDGVLLGIRLLGRSIAERKQIYRRYDEYRYGARMPR